MAVTLTNLIRVDSATSGPCAGANSSAFLATGNAADRSAGNRCSDDGQLIAMLLPESPMTTRTSGLGRRKTRRTEKQHHEHQKNGQVLFHAIPPPGFESSYTFKLN